MLAVTKLLSDLPMQVVECAPPQHILRVRTQKQHQKGHAFVPCDFYSERQHTSNLNNLELEFIIHLLIEYVIFSHVAKISLITV